MLFFGIALIARDHAFGSLLCDKKSAALSCEISATPRTSDEALLGQGGRYGYFLSAISSTYHGQKFYGFRLVVAFLMTVIFMILLL